MIALMALFACNPLGFPSYRQEVVATFADAASAAQAEMSVSALPDGASRAFATRWDDATSNHIAKAAMLERAGVKGNFYLTGKPEVPVPAWASDLVAHGHAVGNHTLEHKHMYALSADEAYRQILLERIRLETALGMTVNSYVSPYGWGAPAWTPERKRNVLWSVIWTGHWVSCDNPLRSLGVPGTTWMAANRFSANDKKPDRVRFETGLAQQIAAADRDPLFLRIVFGTHSWCNAAGNAVQEELLRKWCVRDDWVQLNDWEYGAYRYSALSAQVERRGADGGEARFALRRFEPVSLASAIPLSIVFSVVPQSVSCGGRPLVQGKNGTWILPHDPDRAVRPVAIVCDTWRSVTLKLVPAQDRKTVRAVLENGSDETLRNIAVAVVTPPGCDPRRLTFDVPELAKGARLEREWGVEGTGELFAVNADFTAGSGRVRIWSTARRLPPSEAFAVKEAVHKTIESDGLSQTDS